MIEPQQGLTYAEQLAIVQRAEAVGFEHVLGDLEEAVRLQPLPDGRLVLAYLDENKLPLETLARYSFQQGLSVRQVALGEMFAKPTYELTKI